MSKPPQRPILALGGGFAGAAIVAACVCLSGFFLLSGMQWQGADPALLDALGLPLLAVGLVVIALVSLANGVTWSILVWKQGKRALPWMLLSLCCAVAVPYVLPLALIFVASGPQLEDVLCLCGAPGAVVGVIVLVFGFSLPRQSTVASSEPVSRPGSDTSPDAVVDDDVQMQASQEPALSRGCLTGLVTFGLGLAVPILTAVVCVLLLGTVTFFLLDTQVLTPSSGTPKALSDLLAAAYPLLSPLVIGIASLVISLVLTLVVVVPRIPTGAGKVVNTILFALLSGILSLLFGFFIVARLYNEFYPGYWW